MGIMSGIFIFNYVLNSNIAKLVLKSIRISAWSLFIQLVFGSMFDFIILSPLVLNHGFQIEATAQSLAQSETLHERMISFAASS